VSHTLTIEPLGVELEIENGQTILDAALRAGIYLPHACCHGLCATCKVVVVDGEVDHGEASSFALMDFEREEGKTLACCATVEGDIVIEAEIEEDPDAEVIPIRDFSGIVARIEDLTPTIKGVWIKLDDADGIHFQAGQYVNLHVPGGIGSRAFSIASAPSDSGMVELNIRRVPGGAGTAYVHHQMAEGEVLSLTGPYGRFFVRKSAELPMIFFAGGSGQRNQSELYYGEEFAALAEAHPNFRYIPVLSDEPAGSEWSGARGFAHEAAVEAFENDFRGHKAYLCGPPLMIEACIAALMQGRLFERDIYTEKFLSAADAQQVRSPLFRGL